MYEIRKVASRLALSAFYIRDTNTGKETPLYMCLSNIIKCENFAIRPGSTFRTTSKVIGMVTDIHNIQDELPELFV